MTTPTLLGDVADALLDTAAAALTDPPSRQFVSWAPPVWELCTDDQLTVHLAPLSHRQSRDGRGCQVLPQATLHLQLVRCFPGLDEQGNAPTVALLDSAAKALLVDLWAILNDLYGNAVFCSCDGVTYGQAVPLGPLGQVAGFDITIVVDVNSCLPSGS